VLVVLDLTQIALPRRQGLTGSSKAADLPAFPVAVKQRGLPEDFAQHSISVVVESHAI
jgi:hypothetical protein